MNFLFQLLSSPVALARMLGASLIIFYAANAGNWYPVEILADLAVTYAGALGIATIAKLGGDSVFSRALSKPTDRGVILKKYVGASFLRLPFSALPIAYLAFEAFQIEATGVIGMVLLAIAIVVGNALRIAVSPNYQIGFDNSTFSSTILTVTIFTSIPIHLAILGYSVGLLAVYGFGYVRQPKFKSIKVSFFGFSSTYYFLAELGYFVLGYTTIVLLVVAIGSEIAGVIRSVEQVVFAGTFVLLLTNNRLFHDLSRGDRSSLRFSEYLKRYSLPGFLFFITVFAGIVVAARFGLVPNIAAMPAVFLLYSLGHLISVTCGPVSGYLNFVGEERFVTLSILAGTVPFAIFAMLAFQFENGHLLVLGSVLGTILVNLVQIYHLYFKVFIGKEKTAKWT